MLNKIKKGYDCMEYFVFAIAMVGMILATIGMIVYDKDIKKENTELKTKYSTLTKECESKNVDCGVSK